MDSSSPQAPRRNKLTAACPCGLAIELSAPAELDPDVMGFIGPHYTADPNTHCDARLVWRRLLALAAFLAVLVAPLRAQYIEQPKPSVRIPKPAVADSAWRVVIGCTRALNIQIQPGGDLRDVKWYRTRMMHTEQIALVGKWIPPDTIVLDERVTEQGAVVAHELLHHLLRGPSPPFESHPFVPFFAPCRLMVNQTSSWDPTTGVVTFSDGLQLFPRKEAPAGPL